MKFMLNGALTIGTLDGANVEMCESVGEENMFIFGMKVADVEALDKRGYNPMEFYEKSKYLPVVISAIKDGHFSPNEPYLFSELMENLLKYDRFKLLADFDAYVEKQEEVSKVFQDQEEWSKRCALNIAKAGIFSSDRTIGQYAREIWGVEPDLDFKIPV